MKKYTYLCKNEVAIQLISYNNILVCSLNNCGSKSKHGGIWHHCSRIKACIFQMMSKPPHKHSHLTNLEAQTTIHDICAYENTNKHSFELYSEVIDEMNTYSIKMCILLLNLTPSTPLCLALKIAHLLIFLVAINGLPPFMTEMNYTIFMVEILNCKVHILLVPRI